MRWDAVIIALTLAFLVVASLSVEHFGTARNVGFLMLDLVPIFLLALPMTLIIVTGDIDLSVASVRRADQRLDRPACGTAGCRWRRSCRSRSSIGAVLGAVNGFFITVLGLPSLAVTIGTLALYRGLAYVLLGDTAVADFPRRLHRSWTIGNIGELRSRTC